MRLRYLVAIFGVLITASISQALPPFTPNSVAFSLNPSGRSHIGWCFGDNNWTWTAGSPFHAGDDTYADDWNRDGTSCDQDRGWSVYPTFPGTVIYVGNANNGFGNQVIIRSSQNSDFAMRFAHLDDIAVSLNQSVTYNTLIGHTGDTGTDCVHLHDVLYKNITQLNSSGVTGLSRLQGGHYPQGNSGGATIFAADFYMDGIESAPSPPVAQQPANGASFTDSNNNIVFSWTQVSGAPFYEIWIDNNSGFGSPEIGYNNGQSPNWQNNGIVSATSFNLTPAMQLGLPQNLYFWKVRAVSNSTNPIVPLTDWSSPTREFTLLNQPSPPVAQQPANGQSFTDSNNNIAFSWTQVSGAPFYEIWIDNNSGFGSPEIGYNNGQSPNWQNNGIVSTTSFNLTPAMQLGLPQNLYFWKVRAVSNSTNPIVPLTDWSSPTREFTLLDCTVPAQVQGVSASDNLCSGVTITWTDVANETGYRIRRSGVDLGTVSANFTSYSDNTATPGLLYSYTVQAYNSCGNGPESNPDNGTRASAPNQVTGVTATDGMCANVVITWNNASWENGYHVYRESILQATLGPDVTTYTDNTAVAGVVYGYRVSAFNDCGDGPQSVTDNGFRALAPAQVTGVTATDDLCPEIIVTWNNLAGETGYTVFRDGTSLANVDADVTLYADQTATPGQSYSYRVAANSSCGSGTQSNPDMGTRRAPPGQVTGLAATDDLCNDIVVTWNDVSGEDGYFIYQNMVLITSVPANVSTYTDPNMPPGQFYFYAVKAYNTCGEGGFSNEDVGRTLPAPVQVLGVTASEDDCEGILITWQDQADEQAYYVHRDESSIATVPPNVTSFFDENTTPGEIHSYTVAAGTSCTNGPPSDPDTGVRLEAALAPSTCDATDDDCAQIVVTWTDNSSNELGFNIYRDGSLAGTVGADFELYVDSPVPGNHAYTVKAFSDCGESVASNSDSGTRLGVPLGPPNCQATDTSCAGITISWTDVSTDEAGFEIYRDGQMIGTSAANEVNYFDDISAGAYSYSVAAINGCGVSSHSAPDQGIRLSSAAAPNNCQATDTSCAMIVITWNDNSNNESRFYIYRNNTQLAYVGANVTTYYLLSGVGSSSFYVRAYNPQCGFSLPSNSDSGQFLTAPLTPSWIEASDTSSLGVHLVWDSSYPFVTDYDVYRDDQYVATTTPAIPSFLDEPGDFAPHEYCVVARNQCGESDSACAVGQVLQGLAVPEDLVIKYSGGFLWFYWQPLRDANNDPIPNVVYSIHRGSEPDFMPTEQTYYASTSDTVYVDTPAMDQAYYLIVAEIPPALTRQSTAERE